MTFTIANKPAWASFDASTGRVWGTPTDAQVGNYAGIELGATDGTHISTLRFAVDVTPSVAGSGAATLSWAPPTENTDGSPLANLKGYKIHYGSSSGEYTQVITIDNPGITRYVVDGLAAGTYYFSITAFTSAGVESPFSAEAATTIG